jgi:hypothetical protein
MEMPAERLEEARAARPKWSLAPEREPDRRKFDALSADFCARCHKQSDGDF